MKHDYWIAPRMWPDSQCWIIGGGPSVPRMFGIPEAVIKSVKKQEVPFSVYSEYLSAIHGQNVIATNIAYKLGPWVSAVYFCDKQFWLANQTEIQSFRNLKVTDSNGMSVVRWDEHRNVKKMKRDEAAGITDVPGTIRWNRNAGGGAINLAFHFGVKRILLLGYDMTQDQAGRSHWHAGQVHYQGVTPMRTYDKFLRNYPYIKRDADKLGIEILNVNDNSRLDVFPKVKLEEVL